MKINIYKIGSRNSDDIYITFTKKEYVSDAYNSLIYKYSRYKQLPLDEYYKKYDHKRTFYKILDHGNPYFALIKTVDVNDISEVRQIIKDMKLVKTKQ